MAVIITDMKFLKRCLDCQLMGREKMYCQLHPRKNLNVYRVVSERSEWCPLKSLDDAIDDIQININSMKENAKLHEKGIRQNGEMIAAGLQMALDIIDSYCKENTNETGR